MTSTELFSSFSTKNSVSLPAVLSCSDSLLMLYLLPGTCSSLPILTGVGGSTREALQSSAHQAAVGGFQKKKRKVRVLDTWQGLRLWLIYSIQLFTFLGLPERHRAMRNFCFLLFCSFLAEKAILFQLAMVFSWCFSTQRKATRTLHSQICARWDRGNPSSAWPLCTKPLLHHQEKIVFLTLLLPTKKAKVFIPFVTPCSEDLIAWVSLWKHSKSKALTGGPDEAEDKTLRAKSPPALKPSPQKVVLLFKLQLLVTYSEYRDLRITWRLQTGFKALLWPHYTCTLTRHEVKMCLIILRFQLFCIFSMIVVFRVNVLSVAVLQTAANPLSLSAVIKSRGVQSKGRHSPVQEVTWDLYWVEELMVLVGNVA